MVTIRTYSLAMPPVQRPQPEAGADTPAHAAFCTPQAAGSPSTASRLSAHTRQSSRASFGSAMEGVPERPWRSIARTPAANRLAAASSIFQYTPMEGVPERLEAPAPQQSIRRQSIAGKLRTPATAQQSPAKQASTPVSMSRPDTVLRLHLSPGELASLCSPCLLLPIESQLFTGMHFYHITSSTKQQLSLIVAYHVICYYTDMLQRGNGMKELCAGEEAQLPEISPVVGLLEPQQQPDHHQQQTAAGQYGSMGFFGTLCSAPPVHSPGAHPALQTPCTSLQCLLSLITTSSH